MARERRKTQPIDLLVIGGILAALGGLIAASNELGWVLVAVAGSFWTVGLIALGVRIGMRTE